MTGTTLAVRRTLAGPEITALMGLRKKRDKRQTPAEWAREKGRAGAITEWSVYAGSFGMWWDHAEGHPLRRSELLRIGRDYWWDRGGSLSRLALSEVEWEKELAREIVRELDPLFGGWNGCIWREGHELLIWREGAGRAIPSSVSPILGPENPPPHGTHVRGALGCTCTGCGLALQASRNVKREVGRPRKVKNSR